MSNHKGRPKGVKNRPKPPKTEKKCHMCGIIKGIFEFNKNNGRTPSYCKICMSKYRKDHPREWKPPKNGSICFDETGKIRSEYNIWKSMRNRCYCPTNQKYNYYGGKGVTVSKRWDSFKNFLSDMGPKPTKYHSLDRFPNKKGNYEPGNVRWATPKEQANNTSSNVIYEVDGVSKTLAQWAEEINIHGCVITNRIRKWGWSIKDAVTTPAGPPGKRRKVLNKK